MLHSSNIPCSMFILVAVLLSVHTYMPGASSRPQSSGVVEKQHFSFAQSHSMVERFSIRMCLWHDMLNHDILFHQFLHYIMTLVIIRVLHTFQDKHTGICRHLIYLTHFEVTLYLLIRWEYRRASFLQ